MPVFQVIQRNIREEASLKGTDDATVNVSGYSITKNRYQLTVTGASVGTIALFYTTDGVDYYAVKDSDGVDFSFDLTAKEGIVFDASITGLRAVGSGVTGGWEVKVISSVI